MPDAPARRAEKLGLRPNIEVECELFKSEHTRRSQRWHLGSGTSYLAGLVPCNRIGPLLYGDLDRRTRAVLAPRQLLG